MIVMTILTYLQLIQSATNSVIQKLFSTHIRQKLVRMASMEKDIEILNTFYALCTWLVEDASAEMYSLNKLQ